MRLIIVILTLLSICCIEADLDIAIEEKCVNQIGIDLATFRHKAHAILSANDEDQKVKCVIFCIMEAYKTMNSDATININGFVAEIGAGIRNYHYARTIAHVCDIKGENTCDTAYKVYNCIDKKILEIQSREYNKEI